MMDEPEEQVGEIVELPEEVTDDSVEETDDGGAIIETGPEPVEESDDFYVNLLATNLLALSDTEAMTTELLQRISEDRRSRKEFDEAYAEGIKRTGVGGEAPGGATFQGASRAVHPMLSKAAIDYNARAMAELFPGNGEIVKDKIVGETTQARLEKAQRKVKFMNWQLTTQIPEFRIEMDKLLTQTPIAGSQFLFWCWDFKRGRPMPRYWPSDKIAFPYGDSSIYTTERLTLFETISEFEFKRRVTSGEYFVPEGVAMPASPMPVDQTEAQKATDRAQGQEPDVGVVGDGNHEISRTYTFLEIEKDPENPGRKLLLPYTITCDVTNNRCVSIVRNWEEDDENAEPMLWVAEIPFLPWRGPLSFGLVQFIGSLAGTATGSIRALLDSAHINNLPTLIKLKGANFAGQSETVNATEITEIEGGVAGDADIRKLIMAIPFNPPSLVLLQLLGLVTQEGSAFVQTALDKLGEQRADMPVGTTLALIEQGLKTLSGIHGRLYSAMNQILSILHRLNRMYLTDEEIVDETGELMAKREDFQGPLDVVPVSDPEVFSDVQRFAQMQLVAQRAQLLPQLYDLRKVEELILKRTKIPNATDLLLPKMEPTEMNQVNENVAMAMGRPVVAFPEQDHLAHIQVLLDFLQNPFFGMSRIIGAKFVPAALQHLAEHMLMWYANEFYTLTSQEMPEGVKIEKLMQDKDPEAKRELDKLLATASPLVNEKSQERFAKVPPIIQAAEQFMASMAPQPQDPALQKEQLVQQGKDKDRQAKAAEAAQREQGETQRAQMREQGEDKRAEKKIASDQAINLQDNTTALTIAKAEIAGDERVGVETGTGINPNP